MLRPWVQQGKNVPALANSYLIEYCNNADTFGVTAVRPGGFLSQLDSQQLLTFVTPAAQRCAHSQRAAR